MSGKNGGSSNSNDDPESKTGVDALYVPVRSPDNVETFLQFQWMRAHPSTAIALSDDPSSPAARVARMLPHYRAAATRAKEEKGNNNCSPKGNVSTCSPFFQMSGMQVDLCDLFDPPLLSESVPGCGGILSNESRVDTIVPTTSKRARWVDAATYTKTDTHLTGASRDQILQAVVHAAAEEIHGTVSNRDYLSGLLEPLQHQTAASLLESLHSELFINKVQNDLEPPDYLLLILVLLAEHGACETLGCHILGVLAPAVLSEFELLQIDLSLLKRLARALVNTCNLWKLSKLELQSLTFNKTASPIMEELICCTVESYFITKHQHVD